MVYYTQTGSRVYSPRAYALTGAPMYDEQGNNVNELKTVYVAHLENGKKYIGYTRDFYRRCDQHFSGRGARVTQKYRPYRIDEIERVPGYFAVEYEQYCTAEFMKEFGYDRVRGGKYVNSISF